MRFKTRFEIRGDVARDNEPLVKKRREKEREKRRYVVEWYERQEF
jgi:hypothetical protein